MTSMAGGVTVARAFALVSFVVVFTMGASAMAQARDSDPNQGDSSLAAASRAGGQPVRFSAAVVTVNGEVGFGAPVGLIGGVVEVNPASFIALGAGAGTNDRGLQLAATTRWRIFYWERPKRALAIPVGIGFATGPSAGRMRLELLLLDTSRRQSFERVDWLQLDGGFELLNKNGFHLVLSSGVALPIHESGGTCTVKDVDGSESRCDAQTGLLETFTVMLGYAL